VSRFEEALQVITRLWHSEGPVTFQGRFYQLEHARLDAELVDGQAPPIWIGGSGPRTLGLAGKYAHGWWPAGSSAPERFHEQLSAVRLSAEQAGGIQRRSSRL